MRQGTITLDVMETDKGRWLIGTQGLMSPVPVDALSVIATLETELEHQPQEAKAVFLTVGTKVTYYPKNGIKEHGVVKEVPHPYKGEVRVVYKCNNDWENYKNYTSALTRITDLKIGWQ